MMQLHKAISKFGVLKLKDGTVLHVRVSLYNILEVGYTPVGPEVAYGMHVAVWVESSPEELRKKVADKPYGPMPSSLLSDKSKWEVVEVESSEEAFEEVEFTSRFDGGRYRLRLEIHPYLVARTLEWRDDRGNPVYWIRWWTKLEVVPLRQEGRS